MGNRQKITLGLGALGRAFAPDAAGTDGNQRLADLVARPSWVVVGIDKAGQPCLLIGLQHLSAGPRAHHQNRPGGDQNQRLAQVDTAQEQARDQDGYVGQGGSHIRLDEHHQGGNPNQREGLEDVGPGQPAGIQVGKVSRYRQDEYQLNPFRRLKVHRSNADPAAGAQHFVSHQPDRDQGQKADPISPGSPVEEAMVIDLSKDEHGHHAARDPEDLLGVHMHVGVLRMQGG